MAILEFLSGGDVLSGARPGVVTIISVLLGLCAAFLYLRPNLVNPKGAPPLIKEDWPLIGTFRFFNGRWDFFKEAIAQSTSGSFSFHVGGNHVVGISGDAARKFFFESKGLNFTDGYATLFAGSPPEPKKEGSEEEASPNVTEGTHTDYFTKRIMAMLKGDILRRGIPTMISDTRKAMEVLAADPTGLTNPFDSIYELVYQLTMRTVACNEIAEDPAMLKKTLRLYEEVEKAATPTVVMFPWLPSPGKLKRVWGGAQLYMIFKKIVDDRNKTNRREDDALQYLMDQGDDIRSIITFVLGALFAGQLNSGINAAWVLLYLSQSPEWMARARHEVESVASKYSSDSTLPLPERLAAIPAQAWETDFKVLEMCLTESIRLQLAGSAFRRNTTGREIKYGDSNTIPDGSCVMYHLSEIHMDPEVYPEPQSWNPGRYLPGRTEYKSKQYSYLGWGVARHPCLGQRFAKLENNMLTAFFLAYFDFDFANKDGNTEGVKPPGLDLNAHSARKPTEPTFLKLKRREQGAAA